ncbi:MAG: hypothetical protein AB2L12_11320 [Smithellaceae bacterium]
MKVIFKKYKKWEGNNIKVNGIEFQCPREELEASPTEWIDKAIQAMDQKAIKKSNLKRMKEENLE